MKRVLIGFVFLFGFIEFLIAESDIQLTMPLVRFCEIYQAVGNEVSYEGNNLFLFENSLIKVSNNNFINDSRIGFYDTFTVLLSYSIYNSNSRSGMLFGTGPIFKIFDKILVFSHHFSAGQLSSKAEGLQN